MKEQLFGDLPAAACAPAVFLLAHAEFAPAALEAAAAIYRRQSSQSAGALASALLRESEGRRSAGLGRSTAPAAAAKGSLPVDIRSSRKAMIEEIQARYAGGLPRELFKEFLGHNASGWERIADYIFAREQSLLDRLTVALDHLRGTVHPTSGSGAILSAIREVEHLARESGRLRQDLPL